MTLESIMSGDVNSIFLGDFTIEINHNDGTDDHAIRILFDEEYQGLLDEPSVDSAISSIIMKNSDAADITDDSVFTIEAVAYKILSIQPSPHGTTRVFLSIDEETNE